MKSNILVTGGCGFIGSSFIDLLMTRTNIILLISISLLMHQMSNILNLIRKIISF